MKDKILISDLIDLSQLANRKIEVPKQILSLIGNNLTQWLENLLTAYEVGEKPLILGQVSRHAVVEGRVLIEAGAVVEPHAFIKGPAFISSQAQVRHGAYIRGSVFVGEKAIVGHTTEVKGSVFFDGAKAGHFAYVGDSILGNEVNLGAGTKLANLNLRSSTVKFQEANSHSWIDTGVRKLGAILGDAAQTGCNCVLSPGTILYPKTAVFPCTHFRGTLAKGVAR